MAVRLVLIYPDTSFLIALYGADVFTQRAQAETLALQAPLIVSEISTLEYRNALRLLCFRKLITGRELAARLTAFQKDRQAGLLRHHETDWLKCWQLAAALSEKNTTKGGHRMVDLLHVAVAQSLGAKRFLSFDERQRELAQQQGLTLNHLA